MDGWAHLYTHTERQREREAGGDGERGQDPQTLGGPGALRLPTVGNLKGMTKDERKWCLQSTRWLCDIFHSLCFFCKHEKWKYICYLSFHLVELGSKFKDLEVKFMGEKKIISCCGEGAAQSEMQVALVSRQQLWVPLTGVSACGTHSWDVRMCSSREW